MHCSKKRAHDFHQIPKAFYRETDLVHPRLFQMQKLRFEGMQLPAQGHRVSKSRCCFFLTKVFWVSGDFPCGSVSVFKSALLELAVLGTKGPLVGQPLTLLALPLPVPVGVCKAGGRKVTRIEAEKGCSVRHSGGGRGGADCNSLDVLWPPELPWEGGRNWNHCAHIRAQSRCRAGHSEAQLPGERMESDSQQDLPGTKGEGRKLGLAQWQQSPNRQPDKASSQSKKHKPSPWQEVAVFQ